MSTSSLTIHINNANKIIESVDKIAHSIDTDEEKWKYHTGDLKNNSVDDIYNSLGYTSGVDKSKCYTFVDVVIYDALNEIVHTMPDDPTQEFEQFPDCFEVVHRGSINNFKLEPGDIIRYKKIKKSGRKSQHSLIYYKDKYIAESGIKIRYPIIYRYDKNGKIKWENKEVVQDTIEVIRVKPIYFKWKVHHDN